MSKVATRFAPSPTGPLHIGGVRTALFNWLYSKNQKGSFFLRIEDTDKERSKDEYKKQIIKSLKWLGLNYDADEYIQSKKIEKHVEIANYLLNKGFAYKCYCSEKEIQEAKDRAKQKKIPYIYNGKCREIKQIPQNFKPVIRFKSETNKPLEINDLVQGKIIIEANTIEDFIILRSDGSPTYNLSAAVDDYEMKITYIIRGDDHKINTFKQKQIFDKMKWNVPKYVHVPLIHTIEGKKLSKRDNEANIDEYIKMGILPDSLRNYLLRLGWSHKDKEIFTLDESIKLFNIEGIGKSPAKLDKSRILSINETYIKNMDENLLYESLSKFCNEHKDNIDKKKDIIKKSLHFLKNKAKTLEDIYNNSKYIISDEINISAEDISLINDDAKKILTNFLDEYQKLKIINKENLEKIIKDLIDKYKTNFKGVGQPIRISLIGSKFGPGLYDIILSLDKEIVSNRIKKLLG